MEKSAVAAAGVTVREIFIVCTSVPSVPVTPMKYVPAAVEVSAVRVNMELPDPETVEGRKLAVTPVGSPDAVRVTTPVKLLSGIILAVKLVPVPACVVWELGVADIAKSGVRTGAVTVTVTAPLWVSVPLVPVTVSVYVPATTAAFVEMFRVQLPEVVMDPGAQLASIPVGSPLAAMLTAPVNPFTGATLIVTLVLWAVPTVCAAGATVNVKSGGGAVVVTVTPTVMLWLTVLPAPATVRL